MYPFIAIDHRPCTGCKTCELVCSLYHFGVCDPGRSAIRVIRREKKGLVFCLPLVCQHCEKAACIEACPTGALARRDNSGFLVIDEGNCTSCGICVEACPAGCLSLDAERKRAIGCDLCGGEPQCVPFCHARCLREAESAGADGKQGVAGLAEILKREDLQDALTGRRAR
jgi:carbon-monoxide dehydrogenase iron sulfur subunit